jgi:DNA-directed RNA polymerase beta' subunit
MTKRNLTESEIKKILDFIRPNPNIPADTGAVVAEKTKETFRTQLRKVKIYPDMIPSLKTQIETMYKSSLIQPGESVGIITAQSIGEKQTQSNLNSIDWADKIMYTSHSDHSIIEPIGKFIDELLEKYPSKTTLIPENRTEYLEVKDLDLKIPSCTEKGICSWYKIEAVTRHLPVGHLVKITTKSGREVTVTQSKSLLVWDGKKFAPTNGCDVKTGDLLPTTKHLPRPKPKDTINLKETLPQTSQIDSPKKGPRRAHEQIPEELPLDFDTGFLFGAFASKGHTTKGTVTITNITDSISCGLKAFCSRYKIAWDITSTKNFLIYSDLISELLKPWAGKVPDFAYNSPSFSKGFVDSTFSYDCIINKITCTLCLISKSSDLIVGLATLLSFSGVFCEIETGNSPSLIVPHSHVKAFHESFSISAVSKNQRLTDLIEKSSPSISEKKMDVILDPILSIEKTTGTCEYVYDLTVEKTRNFQIWNGLNVRDTFHKAGSSDKQPVVSKFAELLNATNKPKAPSYMIHFNGGNSTVPELRNTIGHTIVQLTVKRVSKSITACVDKEEEPWYEFFYALYGQKEEKFTDCISLELDMDILYEYRLTIQEIADKLHDVYADCFCVFSPDCIGRMDVYWDTTNVDIPEEILVFVTPDNTREIYLEEVVQPIFENVIICGIPGIMNIFYVKEENGWILETENSNEKMVNSSRFRSKAKTVGKEKTTDSTKRFKRILAHSKVDMTKTVSNNVWDIYYTFGIEATRQYMIDEFSKIMEGINHCHVMLLVDKMTFIGSISSISRYTMRREETGPFGKASFEETLDNFLKAGVFGQEEPTRGVSASIICGKRAPIGTGICDVSMDMKKILQA